jgi:hypothetical protein
MFVPSICVSAFCVSQKNDGSPPKILQRVGIITNHLLMRKFFLFFLGLSGVGWVQAQSLSPEVVATAGDHFATSTAQLSWTLGEPVIETFTDAAATQLTQGFHQTNLMVVAVGDYRLPTGVCLKNTAVYTSTSIF